MANLRHQTAETSQRPRDLIRNARQGLSEEAAVRMPSYNAMQRTIQRDREDKDAADVNKIILSQIVIAGAYALDDNNERHALKKRIKLRNHII